MKFFVGVWQWKFKDGVGEGMVFDVYIFGKCIVLLMLIIDLLLCFDLIYELILCCFYENFDQFVDVFVWVWFKLIYCDMGLKVLYLGFEVLVEDLLW